MSGSNTATINGAAGGLLQDAPGSTIFHLASAPASVIAGAGTDTIIGGAGAIAVHAEGDANNIDVQGGTGPLVFSILDGGGNATITGGSGGETITGGGTIDFNGNLLGSLTVTQAGTLTVHPGAAPITITANGQPITVWASDNSGYEVFAPNAGAIVTISPSNSFIGDVQVQVGAGTPTVMGAGLEVSPAVRYLVGAGPLTGSGNVIAAPAAPVITGLVNPGAVDVSASAGATGSQTPSFSGTGAAGDEVYLLLDGGYTTVGSSIVDQSGHWTITTTTPLAGGNHTVAAQLVDISGVTSNLSQSFTVDIDTAGPSTPAITGLDASTDSGVVGDGITNQRYAMIDGTGDVGDTVTLYDGTSAIGVGTVGAGGTFAVTSTIALSDGQHDLSAVATDFLGVTSAASGTYVLSVETTPPLAPTGMILDAGSASGTAGSNQTNVTRPTIDGAALPDETVTIAADGTIVGSVTADNAGDWSYAFTSPLATGTHAVTATATDTVGNISAATTLDLTIETVAATPTLTGIVANNGGTVTLSDQVNTSSITVSGTASQGATLVVIDNGVTLAGSVVANGSGQWSDAITVQQGYNTLSAEVTYDAAGNASAASAPVVVTAYPHLPTPPAISGVAGGTTIYNPLPTVTGTGLIADFVTLYSNGTVVGTVQVGATGTWSVGVTTALATGVDSLTAIENGPFGHYSAPSAAMAVTVAAFPALTLDPGSMTGTSTSVTGNPAPVLDGVAAPGLAVTLIDNGQVGPTVTADQSGHYAFDLNGLIAGAYTLSAAVNLGAGVTVYAAPFVLTEQTGAPTPTISAVAAVNGGTITAGDLTNAGTVLVTGQGEIGATIRLADNGTLVAGSATVDGSGAWSEQITLSQGANAITAAVTTDGAGASSSASAPVTLTALLQAPAAPAILGLASASDSGTQGDNRTVDTSVTILGTGVVGETVTLTDQSTSSVLGTATVMAGGTWSVTGSLAAGAHTLVATESDALGDASAASSAVAVTIDNAPPPPMLVIPGGNTTGNLKPAIDVLPLTPGENVSLFDNGLPIGTLTNVVGAVTFTPAASLFVGANTITAVSTDPYGNTGPVNSVVIDVQGTPTTITLAPGSDSGIAADNLTNVLLPQLTGLASANSTVTVLDNGAIIGSATVDAGGTWSLTPGASFVVGANTLTAFADLGYGNTVAASPVIVTVETTAAAAVISAATATNAGTVTVAGLTNAGTVTLTGSAGQNATLALADGGINLGTVVADGTGAWSAAVPLVLGANTLTATVLSDAAGNSGPASSPFVLTDFSAVPAAPVITGIAQSSDSGEVGDNRTDLALPVIVGTGTPGTTVLLKAGSTPVGIGAVAGNGTWSASVNRPLTVASTTTLTAITTDQFGSQSVASGGYAVTIDPRPAQPVISTAFGGTTDSRQPDFSITTSSNTGLSVYDNGTLIGTTTISAAGTIDYAPATPLPIGVNAITVVAANAYGDVSTPGTFNVTIQPDAPTLSPGSDSGVPNDGITNVLQPVLTGFAAANGLLTVIDNGASLGTTTADGNGNWSFTPGAPLSEGLNAITASFVSGGTTVTSGTLELTIATSATTPTISGAAPANGGTITLAGLTNAGTVTLAGNAAQGDTLVVIDNGITLAGRVIAGVNNTWSDSVSLQPGANLLTARVVADVAGNASAASAPLSLTDYPVTPAAPGITGLAAADGLGAPGGTITASPQPTLSGTGEAGDTVTLLSNGTIVGTGTVDAGGTWSAGIGTMLPVGVTSLTATETNPFGGSSAASSAFALTIAALPGMELDPASISGVSLFATSDRQPQFDGIAAPLARVVVIDNGTAIGTVTADGTGAYSFTAPTDLAVGWNTLEAQVTFTSGAQATSAPLTVLIEPTLAAPSLVLSPASDSGTPGDNLTNVTTPTLTGVADPDSTVSIAVDGAMLPSVTADASGAFSYTLTTPLAAGTHVITASFKDLARDISPTGTLDVSIETVAAPPSILSFAPNTGLIAGNNDTSAGIITLHGSATAGSDVTIDDNGTPVGVATATGGTWTFLANPALGANSYTAQIGQDPAGNASQASAPFVVTRFAPPGAPVITGLAAGSDSGSVGDDVTNVTTPTLIGTGTVGDLINITDGGIVVGSGTVAAGGTWSVGLTTPLANGPHDLLATQTDPAASVSAPTGPLVVTIDTTAPAAPTVSLAGSAINPTLGSHVTDLRMPGLGGTAPTNDLITVMDGATLIGSVTAAPDGTWSLEPLVALPLGAQVITATATDDVGNVSAAGTLAVTISNVPTAAPSITLAPVSDSGVQGDNLTNVARPTLTGSAPAGDTVVISADDIALGTVVATAQGVWTFTPAGTLTSGAHVLQAVATDPITNTGHASTDYTLTIDTTPPAAPTVQAVPAAMLNGTGTLVSTSATPLVTGTGIVGDTITLLNGGNVLATTTVAAGGTWAVAPGGPLQSGVYELDAQQTDAAGNVSATCEPLSLTVQLGQPLSINDNVTFSGAATAAIQQVLGQNWTPGAPVNVTPYTATETPPTPANGSVLALTLDSSDNGTIQSIPANTPIVTDVASGAVTLVGGTGPQLVVTDGGSTTYFTNGGSGVYLGNQGSGPGGMGVDTVTAGSNVVVMPDSGGGNFVVDTGAGNDSIFAGSGDDSIAPGAGNNVVTLGDGHSIVMDTGNDTVVAGSGSAMIDAGADTVAGTGKGVLLFGEQSTLSFINGSGNATVVGGQTATVFGGTGRVTTFGAAGNGTYFGGKAGDNVLVTGEGASTLVGSQAGGDLMVVANDQDNMVVGAGGSETLFGAAATGNNAYYGGSGSTAILSGHGNDTVVTGTGTSTVFAGTGNTLTFAQGPDVILANTGNQTIVGGNASELYGFASGLGGGSSVIFNFNPGLDHVDLWGYSAAELTNALAGQTSAGQSAAIHLSDGTRITFVGVSHLDATSFSVG